MTPITWQIGHVFIKQVTETDAGSVIQSILPDATPAALAKAPWLSPAFVDSHGTLRAVVQSFVIESQGVRILVDTCVGNGKIRKELAAWNQLQTDFLGRLADAGYPPDTIDLVACTHLHFDHVGWNTRLVDARWTPTFPNARYLFVRDEFNYWRSHPDKEIEDDHAGFADSVLPIAEAGRADLVSSNHALTEEVSLFATPGHTPHHVSVLIESHGKRAIVTGDALHHPCQIANPDWSTISDTDKGMARSTRWKLLGQFADRGILLIGSHFAAPTAGVLCRSNSTFQLQM